MTDQDKTIILDELTKLSDKINDAKVAAAEVGTNVKTLMKTVDSIEEKMTAWENGGCPFGRVDHQAIQVHAKEISKAQYDIEKLKNGKREQIMLGMSSGTAGGAIASFIGQIISSMINRP